MKSYYGEYELPPYRVNVNVVLKDTSRVYGAPGGRSFPDVGYNSNRFDIGKYVKAQMKKGYRKTGMKFEYSKKILPDPMFREYEEVYFRYCTIYMVKDSSQPDPRYKEMVNMYNHMADEITKFKERLVKKYPKIARDCGVYDGIFTSLGHTADKARHRAEVLEARMDKDKWKDENGTV